MLSSTSDDPIQMSECVLDTYTQTSHIHVQMYYFCEGMCSSIKNKLEYHHLWFWMLSFFSSVHYIIRCRTVLVGQYICFQAMYFIPFFVWWCRICGLALDWWIVLCRSQKSHHTCLHFHSKREVSRWKKKISSNIHYQKWDYTFRPFGTERAF